MTTIKILGKERELYKDKHNIYYLNNPKDIEQFSSYGKTLEEWKSYAIRIDYQNQTIKEHNTFHNGT